MTHREDNELLDGIEARLEEMAQEITLWKVAFWVALWAIAMWLGILAMHIE